MNVQGNRKEADDSLEHQLAAAYREISHSERRATSRCGYRFGAGDRGVGPAFLSVFRLNYASRKEFRAPRLRRTATVWDSYRRRGTPRREPRMQLKSSCCRRRGSTVNGDDARRVGLNAALVTGQKAYRPYPSGYPAVVRMSHQ